jgi:hypothetical protein
MNLKQNKGDMLKVSATELACLEAMVFIPADIFTVNNLRKIDGVELSEMPPKTLISHILNMCH